MYTKEPYNTIEELIAAYFTEGLQDDELKELHQWMQASEENKRHFARLQEIWFSSIGNQHAALFDKNEAYERFLNKTKTQGKPTQRRSTRSIVWYAAAAIVLLFIVSYTSFYQGSKQVTDRFADVVIEAPKGSRTKTYLPDGSLVWLNCSSKITYSQGFGVNDRKIFLTGEAYFEVIRNEKAPFVVRTEELKVDVLGTKFNFRNYPDDEEATVSLLEGKVQVSNRIKKNEIVQLSPNQKVFYNKQSGKMRIVAVNAAHTSEWTNGNLFFDEELLPDIIKELERNYNVRIELADKSLETFRFYGDFIVTEHSIEDIIGILAKTNKIQYSIKGRDITLSVRG